MDDFCLLNALTIDAAVMNGKMHILTNNNQ